MCTVALAGTGDAGFGVVIRNLDGNWIGGVSSCIDRTTNFKAELHAILQGLRRKCEVVTNGSTILYSDSQEALRFIIFGTRHDHPYSPLSLAIDDALRDQTGTVYTTS